MDLPIIPAINLRLEVACGEAFDVRRFSACERIGKLYDVHLVVRSRNADVPFDELVGEPTVFTIDGSVAKSWHGVIRQIELVRAERTGLSTYQIHLSPTAWLMTQRRNYRIFQNRSEVEIALAVLAEWRIEPIVRVALASYPPRDFRVQYGESDFDFVSRMLEEAGVSFYFETPEDGPTRLVLDDAPHSRKPVDALPFVAELSTAPDVDRLATAVRATRRVRPGRYTVRDYDQRLAPDFDLAATGRAGTATALEDRLERYHYVPGSALIGEEGGGNTPSADDRGRFRASTDHAARIAQRRVEAKRGDAWTISFEARARDLAAGVVTSIADHPSSAARDVPLLVIEQVFEGTALGEWTQHCRAHTATQPYRPSLDTPRPHARGVETATVVGPAGEEIHTDELGRIRVHFHWDREGTWDENASCWLHVSHPWAGAGFGGVNLPRVGQEVIVEFLGGDPDRPIVTGRVYTATQAVPFGLPAAKTQSGWKSASTNGTGGYNEIMFEDAAGSELLRLRAEKDLSGLVLNDETWIVQNDRRTAIGRDDELMVGRDRTVAIARDSRSTVLRDSTSTVAGSATTTVAKNRRDVTAKSHSTSVGRSRSAMVGVSDSVTVGATRSAKVGLRDSTTVGLSHSVTAGRSQTFAVGLGALLPFGKPSATVKLSKDKIVLSTKGGATLILEKNKIILDAEIIELAARKEITQKAKEKITLDGEVGVDVNGGLVALNGPGLPAGRLTDPAPQIIANGSATVHIGGPSLPFDVEVVEEEEDGDDLEGSGLKKPGSKPVAYRRMKNGTIRVGKNITIKGSRAFQSDMLARLGKMNATKSGSELLKQIQASDQKMLIEEVAGRASCGARTVPGLVDATKVGERVFGGGGSPFPGIGTGQGTDVTCRIDSTITLQNALDPNNPMPKDAVLFHEMSHGYHYMNGQVVNTPMGAWTTLEERVTIIGPNSEAEYLREIGYPWRRADHDSTWVPNP